MYPNPMRPSVVPPPLIPPVAPTPNKVWSVRMFCRLNRPISRPARIWPQVPPTVRSEEHTSELQSLTNLVCRLLLEKKKKKLLNNLILHKKKENNKQYHKKKNP